VGDTPDTLRRRLPSSDSSTGRFRRVRFIAPSCLFKIDFLLHNIGANFFEDEFVDYSIRSIPQAVACGLLLALDDSRRVAGGGGFFPSAMESDDDAGRAGGLA
jgi:hypothetical protein